MLFTALHRALAEAPGQLTNAMIEAAVAAGLTETEDLDWKSALPKPGGLSETDFPKDVAAMANRGGGIIIYGVTEKDKKATGRTDVGELSEHHDRAMHAVVLNAISPPVFGVEIFALGESVRAVAVVIPDSSETPHLIYKNYFFGAPVRNDADTDWMPEGQIERAYRARFESRRNSTEAVERMYDDEISGRNINARAWIVLVARPRLPILSAPRPDRVQARHIFIDADIHIFKYATSTGTHPLASVDRDNLRTGLRRWRAVSATVQNTRWREAWASAHHDGSVSITAAVGAHPVERNADSPGGTIEAIDIEAAVADFMGLIRSASQHTGAREYEVKVGIEYTGPERILIRGIDGNNFALDDDATPLAKFTPVLATVNADTDDDDFHRQVFELAEDCVNQGGVTQLRLINPVQQEPPAGPTP
jgi:hypothetical protein